jgi:type I restriction enzyme S subunit
MQQLLTGKKRFAGFDECWESIRLRDVLKGKKCKGKIVPTNAELKGLPYIGSTSFEGDFGLYSDSEEAVTCSPTDILMLWDGENAGKVATNLIGVVSSTVVRCRLNTANANNEFIAYCLLKDNYKIRAIREGSGIPHMPGDFEYWYEFQLPIFKEQQKIAATLSTADREIQVHQNQLTALKQQKKALMQQLLTGKKRVMIAEAA